MRSTTIGVAAFTLVAALAAGCGSNASGDRNAIAKAREAHGFAPFASIFPRRAESTSCSVSAGPAGNTFRGVCSTAVTRGRDGQATVTFVQDFGTNGRHVWRILVTPSGRARVVAQSGGGLVQLIP